jgi:HAE1 family hydrophobic/amphiphilic exporter-1
MTAVRRLLTIASLAVAAMPLVAQTPAPATPARRATAPVTAETDQDLNNPRAMRLSLDEAIRATMQNNLGIQIQRLDYRMAGESLRSSYGIFDWFSTGTVAHTSARTPTISQFQSSGGRSTVFDVGVSQLIPTGATYSLGFNNSRATTAGGGTFISPAYRSNLDFNLTQPLLRNFGVDVTRRGVTIARNTLGINREAFRSALITTADAVEQAYLDVVYTRQNVDVLKESLFLARDQARITQIRIDVGASAPLDILQPRVQIATSEESLIAAVANVRDAEDRLRALMHLPPGEWDRPIIPTDPVGYTPVSVDMQQAVTRAFELRPELQQQHLTTDIRRVQYVYARNQVLPRVDFAINYNPSGVAGRAAELDPVTGEPTGRFNSTGINRALSQVFGNDFPTWTVGFNFGVPVLNIGARAEARRAELDWRTSQTDEEQVRQNIAVEVRSIVRAVDTSAKEIAASRAAREAAEQNVDAERKRYENGMTTNFQVLQIQQQLSDTRVRELQALVGYNKAVSAYHRAIGDLLDVRNIRIEEPAAEDPRIFSTFDRYNWLNYGHRLNLQEKTNDSQPR